jgi:hypothetical protein
MNFLSLQFLVLFVLVAISRAPADRLSEGRPMGFLAFTAITPAALIGASTLDGKDPTTAIVVGTIQSLLLALGTATLAFGRWRCRSLDAGRMPGPAADEG